LGFLDESHFQQVQFGNAGFAVFVSEPDYELVELGDCRSPNTVNEALAFASALNKGRSIDASASFERAVYIEQLSLLLPTRTEDNGLDDSHVLGAYLTGGLRISAAHFNELKGALSWLSEAQLLRIVDAAGLAVLDRGDEADFTEQQGSAEQARTRAMAGDHFDLPGRPEIEQFFNDHVIDVVRNPQLYQTLGIGNPGGIILEGPSGGGKTYAVRRLVEFLGWPEFAIDASSVASPYIHETSRKVSAVFQQAIAAAPSVVVFDEMEAFLGERDGGVGQHRVEEVAEFLRRIPEAIAAGVLIIGMTNRVDLIDPAIRRTGRFDHTIHVGFPERQEVRGLLDTLFAKVPVEDDVDFDHLAGVLAGRPMSDAAFVVREAARLAAKARRMTVDGASVAAALKLAPEGKEKNSHRIGFI
jgi:Cdc6-like AAA superfamily ATPase